MAGSSYSLGHVRALIEGYYSIKERVDTTHSGLEYLAQLVDLDDVLSRLPDSYWEITFSVGLLGMTQREVAEGHGVSQQAIGLRYENALAEIHHQINNKGGSRGEIQV